MTSNLSDSNHPGTLFSGAHYNAAGALISGTLDGGVINESRCYDGRLRLSDISDTALSNTLYHFQVPSSGYCGTSGNWAYAPNDNIVATWDSVNGNTAFGYDAFNRLVAANGTVIGSYTYAYDRFGNRWQQNGPHTMTLSFSGNNNHMDGYSYDAAGNLLNDGTTTYSYDAENRIISATNTNGTTTYVYDAEGRRVQKTVGGVATQYLYDLNGNEMASVGVRDEIYAGGRHIATYANGTTLFNFSDNLGTERVRVNVSGNVCETITSLPFGDGMTVSGSCSDSSPMHFTGKERDSESGLDNFGARYDSSQYGRFMTPDWSARPTPVPFADLANPQSLNLYSYVANNPLSRIDKDGHYACQGDKAQCQAFKDALAIVQKADSGLKEGSKERKQLDSVLKFYGKDDGKGPGIKFGDLGGMGAVGVTQTDHGKTTITFDTAALSGMTKVGQGETAAHEGTHGRDDHMPGVGAGLFWKFYDTEYHAYQSESYVDMGLGKASETDKYPSWAPGMSYSDHVRNITRDAYDNASLDCKNAGCAP